MKGGLRPRFWVEVTLATLSGVALLLDLVSKEWIEFVFRVDPDHGSGLLEAVIVVVCLAATVISSMTARREWRRAAAAA